MHRQLSDKDCAVTALAHALGMSYTSLVNSFSNFRYLRARRRTRREKADQIIGRCKRLGTTRRFDQVIHRSDFDYNRHRYNYRYRSGKPPYFAGFGLGDTEYKSFLTQRGVLYVQKVDCTLDMLRHIPFAVLSLPSINVKNSGHMVIWRAGRIWDPSPKKRYNYMRLRQAAGITCLALAGNDAEYQRLYDLLEPTLHGHEIVTTLIFKIIKMTKAETENDDSNTGWKVADVILPQVEDRLIMDRSTPL